MSLSKELLERGFIYQTTLQDVRLLDTKKYTFYLGVDPSADSMTIGHFAVAMLARHLIDNGHKAVLLVGGATGQIGDPDGKKQERDMIDSAIIEKNKKGISDQFNKIFEGKKFVLVDNNDWFKNINYIWFLRNVGKKIPLRTMLSRDFIQSRIGQEGSGISYAEFSYSLIQAYDFLHLNKQIGVNLQICGADQWGNSIAGVDLVRRSNSNEVDILSTPLIVDRRSGRKFGKTEEGAIWLDPKKTSITMFYQFWINTDDEDIEQFFKIFTLFSLDNIKKIVQEHSINPKLRLAQQELAYQVTSIVHGEKAADIAQKVTSALTGKIKLTELTVKEIDYLKKEIPSIKLTKEDNLVSLLVKSKLVSSNSEARSLIQSKAIRFNNIVVEDFDIKHDFFKKGLALLRKGKAYKDSAIIEN